MACRMLAAWAAPLAALACSSGRVPASDGLASSPSTTDESTGGGDATGRTPGAEVDSPPDGGAAAASLEPAVVGDDALQMSARGIVVRGRRVFVDGEALYLRGVCWNPVGRGNVHPEGLDFAGFAEQDVPLLAALGVNVVRTYEPLLDEAVLDRLFEAGIRVLNSVYPYGGASPDEAVSRVQRLASHPAILMWVVGNEWNYNGLYAGLSHEDSLALVAEVTARIRAEDPTHPIATVYGELPSEETIAALPDVDVWGINSYRGISFGGLFDDWQARSGAPMFLAEYGADAYDARLERYDPDSQAEAVAALTRELVARAAAFDDGGLTLGGSVFEWADEWWKDDSGSPDVQDVGGSAPGGGPYPDSVFNEEWWGLVDVDRNPRPAYDALAAVFASLETGR